MFLICYSIVATFIAVNSKMIAAFALVRVCDCVCALCVLPHFQVLYVRKQQVKTIKNAMGLSFVITPNWEMS